MMFGLMQKHKQHITAGKRIPLVFGKLNICFHEECFILAEKTQLAFIRNCARAAKRWRQAFENST